jgi:hypothetical protein
MKRNILIMVGVVLLLMATLIYVCSWKSPKVDISTQIKYSTEYQIADSVKYVIPDYASYNTDYTDAISIDGWLSFCYRKFLEQGVFDYENIHSMAFEKILTDYLSSPVTFDNTLDTLETLMKIRQSLDKKIKFYTWLDVGNGIYEYMSFAQFQGTENQIQCVNFSCLGFGIGIISKVYAIVEGRNTYYLTLGWGMMEGIEHDVVSLFRIDGDSLIKCKAHSGNQLIIPYPLFEPDDYKKAEYDDVKKTLSFDNYTFNEDDVLEYKGYKTLKFSNGKFR